jgi:hypothetical protein
MDTNLNGRITREEVTDTAESRFALLDTHQQGYLLLAELPESYAQHHHVEGHKSGSGTHHGRGGHPGGRPPG